MRARFLTVANVIIVIALSLLVSRGTIVERRSLILLLVADNAKRFFAVLKDGGRTVTSHDWFAAQVVGQLLIEGSHARRLKSVNGTGGTLMNLRLIISLNSIRKLDSRGIFGEELDALERKDSILVVEANVDGDRSLVLHEHNLERKESK